MKREIVVWTLIIWILVGVSGCAMMGGDASKVGGEKVDDKLEDYVTERNERYKEELELWLRKWLVDDYPARAERLWSRSYESVEAFKKSVEPNRNRWREILNPPPLRSTGPLEREPHEPLSDLDAQWLSLPLGGIKAEGVLVIPNRSLTVTEAELC